MTVRTRLALAHLASRAQPRAVKPIYVHPWLIIRDIISRETASNRAATVRERSSCATIIIVILSCMPHYTRM
jgi:hypothetical protein